MPHPDRFSPLRSASLGTFEPQGPLRFLPVPIVFSGAICEDGDVCLLLCSLPFPSSPSLVFPCWFPRLCLAIRDEMQNIPEMGFISKPDEEGT